MTQPSPAKAAFARKAGPAPTEEWEIRDFITASCFSEGMVKTVAFVEKYGDAHVDITDSSGMAAFQNAAIVDRPDVMEYLLQHGANIDRRVESAQHGWNAVIMAATNGREEALRCLFKHGAKVDQSMIDVVKGRVRRAFMGVDDKDQVKCLRLLRAEFRRSERRAQKAEQERLAQQQRDMAAFSEGLTQSIAVKTIRLKKPRNNRSKKHYN